MPHYIVESIEFDFSDSMGTIPEEEQKFITENVLGLWWVDACLLYTSPSPRDPKTSRMPSSA